MTKRTQKMGVMGRYDPPQTDVGWASQGPSVHAMIKGLLAEKSFTWFGFMNGMR